MSLVTLEGTVEGDRVLLPAGTHLPAGTKCYVVVPDAPSSTHRVWGPRLADPRQKSDFVLKVIELDKDSREVGDVEL